MKKVIVFALAIVLSGAMLPISVVKLKSYDRTVDVKGLCEREVKADKVIWPITYKIVGDNIGVVLSQMEKCNADIVAFLRKGGVGDAEITIATPQISDKYVSEYGNNDRVYRYLLTGVITVCSTNVDAAVTLQSRQSELMKQGVPLSGNSWENQIQFKFEGLNDIKPEMIESATANAREAAQKFAQDSGSRIGKIRKASQGTFTIEDRDSNTPYIKKVRVVSSVTYYIKH